MNLLLPVQLLLAASPYAAIVPGTQVTFHQTEAVAEFSTPELRGESERSIRDAESFYREVGVPDSVLEMMQRHQFWTPDLNKLVQMNLVKLVYDLEQRQFLLAADYCADHKEECASTASEEPRERLTRQPAQASRG